MSTGNKMQSCKKASYWRGNRWIYLGIGPDSIVGCHLSECLEDIHGRGVVGCGDLLDAHGRGGGELAVGKPLEDTFWVELVFLADIDQGSLAETGGRAEGQGLGLSG